MILSTHTERHLERTLAGIAAQTLRPASLVVSCDGQVPAAESFLRSFAEGSRRDSCGSILLVQRAHTGKSRSSQVRNNGVRALLSRTHAPSCILVFLDGDCVPAPDLLEVHRDLCFEKSLVIGFRHDLTETQTTTFDPTKGLKSLQLSPDQAAALATRAARYRRQALLRRLGIAKPHKPKLLSANFSVRLSDYLAVNGFDERYEGYGQEDDDLGRRLYAHGCRPVIAIQQAITFHQYHLTRAPGDWHAAPNVALFAAGGPTRAVQGVENPVPQPPVEVVQLGLKPA